MDVPAPVVLLHSGGLTSRQWRKLGELLAPRFRVLAPDMIGYGAEPRVPAGVPFHFRDDVARIAAMIAALDRPAHLVGHSYGGLIALQVALAHPERVARIAVYEPVAFGVLDEPADAPARATLGQLRAYQPDAAGLDEGWLADFVGWWQGAGTWEALTEDARRAFRDVAWKLSQEVTSLAADRTGAATYATIAAPVLLLAGARTQPAELDVVRKLARILPRATLELVDGAGHMGPITHAAAVNAAIAAFLGAVG